MDSHGGHPPSHAAHDEAPGPVDLGQLLAGVLGTAAVTAAILYALLWPYQRPVSAPLPAAAAHAGAAVHHPAAAGPLGALVDRTLPGGAQLRVPEHGVEGRLVAFLADPARPADKTTWFDFDRLVFATGSAQLGPESQDQLQAVAEILRAFPASRLKIGGYTDNVGDAPSNQRLSEARAASVRAALLPLGVAPARLEAEGYGEQFPVADNGTAEGRARNRRISMRVMEK